jgi:hypothetical protein
MVTYRLVEGPWHLSVTGQLGLIAIRAGAVTPLELRDGVKVNLRANALLGDVQAQVQVLGPRGGGLSIYRDGKRVPLTCKLVDRANAELGSAALRYG